MSAEPRDRPKRKDIVTPQAMRLRRLRSTTWRNWLTDLNTKAQWHFSILLLVNPSNTSAHLLLRNNRVAWKSFLVQPLNTFWRSGTRLLFLNRRFILKNCWKNGWGIASKPTVRSVPSSKIYFTLIHIQKDS